MWTYGQDLSLIHIFIVDTPGIHKPKDGLGSELNKSALGELSDVDVIAFVIDASAPIGRGDAWVAERVAAAKAPKVLVLTKADLASPDEMLKQLEAARVLVDFDDEIVVSSTEGFNVEAFVDVVAAYLPQGPRWFPEGMGTDAVSYTHLINTCAVTGEAESKTRKAVRHALGLPREPIVVVTGCVVNLHPNELTDLSPRVIAQPSKIDVARTAADAAGLPARTVNLDEGHDLADLLGRSRLGVKVQDGCNNRCSYCICLLYTSRCV